MMKKTNLSFITFFSMVGDGVTLQKNSETIEPNIW